MKVSYVSANHHLSTGSPMRSVEMIDILNMCKSMEKSAQKHIDGCIFPVLKDTLGNADLSHYKELYYDGLLFIDLDHLTVDVADTLFNGFEELYKRYPFFYAIQYSSSYYLRPESNDVGVHIYIYGPTGDGYDYRKYAYFSLAVVSELIMKHFGINLKEMEGVLDTHNCKIGQRFFLYHSDYKVNPNCFPMSAGMYDKNVDKLKDKYHWFDYLEETDAVVKFENQFSIEGKIQRKIQLDYSKECLIANFLAANGWNVDKIAAALYLVDNRDDNDYFTKHKFTRAAHFKQIARTAMGRSVTEGQRDAAINLLRGCGLYIQEERENIFSYIPMKVFSIR